MVGMARRRLRLPDYSRATFLSSPVPWGFIKEPKALVADEDYYVTVTAHFSVNRVTRLEGNMGRYGGEGSVVRSVNGAVFMKSVPGQRMKRQRLQGGCGLNSAGLRKRENELLDCVKSSEIYRPTVRFDTNR